MKKSPSRRSQVERRKSPRSGPKSAKTAPAVESVSSEACAYCDKPLAVGDRALFVEEEVGRSFCTEDCITSFFAPEVERLEAEYQRRLTAKDVGAEERETLQHLRWATLQEPDEVWREKTLTGDFRYTLIAQFEGGVWCVCLSLFLRGEPSFLFLCALTRNAAVVETYRRGERMSWVKRKGAERTASKALEFTEEQQALDGTVIPGIDTDLMEAAGFTTAPSDGLALDGWSTEESLRAAASGERNSDDIQPEEFGVYQNCLEETLQEPSELWSLEATNEEEEVRLYHFIKHYPDAEQGGFWYVIVAREVAASETEEEHLEVLDSFPTRDVERLARYRQGTQELDSEAQEQTAAPRVLH